MEAARAKRVFTDMEKWSEIRRLVLADSGSKRSVFRQLGDKNAARPVNGV